MTTANQARDYLGHACQLSMVHILLEEKLDSAREKHSAGADPRRLPREIGNGLRRLMDRLEHNTAALQALPRPDDDDGTGALTSMAAEYSIHTENLFHDLAALILVALERGEGYPEHLKPESEGGDA